MGQEDFIGYLLAIIGLAFSAIGFMIAFYLHGNREELKEIRRELGEFNKQLASSIDAVNERINQLERRHNDIGVEIDRRVSHIEGICNARHA